jgi:hypothetical protein
MSNMKTEPKRIADYFKGSKARRQFFGGENLLAYDVAQLHTWERGFATSRLGRKEDGLPPTSILITCWRRARDSFERVMKALPQGELKDEMALELQIRDAAMGRQRSEGSALCETRG